MPAPTDLFPVLARDAIALFATRADFDEERLDGFAKRRAALYEAAPHSEVDESFWTSFAAALAPVAPPEWLPMSGLIDAGATLEGGRRGLRGLIFKEPWDRDRRRIVKLATLAGRILDIVAGTTKAFKNDEQRLVAMTMASFGLTADELAKSRSTTPVTFENLEIFGELDVRTRRELLRGAWQLALLDALDPSRDVVVRGIAARLETSTEYDALRADVLGEQTERGEMCEAAVALLSMAMPPMTAAGMRPWIDHLLIAAAPPAQRERIAGLVNKPPDAAHGAKYSALRAPRRRQAVSLANATLLAADLSLSETMQLRARLHDAAEAIHLGDALPEALDRVDRYVYARMREHSIERAAELPAGASTTR